MPLKGRVHHGQLAVDELWVLLLLRGPGVTGRGDIDVAIGAPSVPTHRHNDVPMGILDPARSLLQVLAGDRP